MQCIRKLTKSLLHNQNVFLPCQYYLSKYHSKATLDDIDYLLNIKEDSLDLLPTLHAMLRSKPIIKEAIESQNMNVNPYVIADYGGADGRTSLPLVYYIVGLLKKKYGQQQQFHVHINDRPSHDFRPLFERYEALFASPCRTFENVSISANGRSFYNQCFPDNSVHLGLSNYGLNWMSSVPKLRNAVFFKSIHATSKEYEQATQQMALDWQKVLELRARELVTGGMMCVVLPTSVGETEAAFIMETNWMDVRDKGLISQEEMFETNMPTEGTTPEIIQAPFAESHFVQKSGLRLQGIYNLSYTTKYSSKEQQAQILTAYVRNVGGTYFVQALSESKSPEDRENIMEEFYQTVSRQMLESRATLNAGALIAVIRKVSHE